MAADQFDPTLIRGGNTPIATHISLDNDHVIYKDVYTNNTKSESGKQQHCSKASNGRLFESQIADIE